MAEVSPASSTPSAAIAPSSSAPSSADGSASALSSSSRDANSSAADQRGKKGENKGGKKTAKAPLKVPKGTRDHDPKQMAIREHVLNTIQRCVLLNSLLPSFHQRTNTLSKHTLFSRNSQYVCIHL